MSPRCLVSSRHPRLATAFLAALGLVVNAASAEARNLMAADGPGGMATYDLLKTAYTVEVPDCGHMVPHITEVMDDELKKNVFVFHAHVGQDDDRCTNSDRQRTEIRGRDAQVIANNGDTVYYRWKFKLASGFQGSSSFTHIFQIKSDLAAPVMTLTPRTSTMAIDGRIGARGATNLSKFIGVWVVVELKILFSNAGRVEMTIRKHSDGEMLFQYAGAADMWDDNASAHDPKYGIYRSLNNRGSLRDEQVRFADFCASRLSFNDCDDGATPPPQPPADGGAPDAGNAPDASMPPADATAPPAVDAGAPDTTMPPPTPDAGPAPTPRPDAAAPDTRPRPDAAAPPSDPEEPPPGQGGCACDTGSTGAPGASGLVALAFALVALRLRRRRR